MSARNQLQEIIAASGPVGFDELVNVSLYDPDHGWYSGGGRSGRGDGHFITSPEVGPLFGRIVARWLDGCWNAAGRPGEFIVAEVGAGRGRLARSILAAQPQCAKALHYLMVEQSEAQRAEHGDVIAAGRPGQVRSVAELPEAGPTTRINVVLANELLDNLPFQVARYDPSRVEGDGWAELRIDLNGDGELTEVLAPLTTTRAELTLLKRIAASRESSVIDVPLARAARSWVKVMRDRADHLLVFDYGEPTAVLADRPDRGWLRTYRSNGRGSGPLRDLGHQDITIDVPVDQLPPPRSSSRQKSWLERHGLMTELRMAERELANNPGMANLAAIRAQSASIEAAALTDPAGLGNFIVAEW